MVLRGDHVAKNRIEAAKWYKKAAEQGNAEAQYNPGTSYLDGKGILVSCIFPNVGIVIGCPALFQIIEDMRKAALGGG